MVIFETAWLEITKTKCKWTQKSVTTLKDRSRKVLSLNVEHWLGFTEVRLGAGSINISYVLSRLNMTWGLISKGKIEVKEKKKIQIFYFQIDLIYIFPFKINLQWLFYQIWSGKINVWFKLVFEIYIFIVSCWMLSFYFSWEWKKKEKG